MHFMEYIVIGMYIGFFLGFITACLFRRELEDD